MRDLPHSNLQELVPASWHRLLYVEWTQEDTLALLWLQTIYVHHDEVQVAECSPLTDIALVATVARKACLQEEKKNNTLRLQRKNHDIMKSFLPCPMVALVPNPFLFSGGTRSSPPSLPFSHPPPLFPNQRIRVLDFPPSSPHYPNRKRLHFASTTRQDQFVLVCLLKVKSFKMKPKRKCSLH